MNTAERLKEILVKIKENASALTKAHRPCGICAQFEESLPHGDEFVDLRYELRQLFEEIMEHRVPHWPQYSGIPCYPVSYHDEEDLRRMWSMVRPEYRPVYFDDFGDEETDGYVFENLTPAGKAELAFDYSSPQAFWGSDHKYGRARLDLLDFMIKEVESHV